MSRSIVITGASAGIGAALARHLAPAGARLTLVGRRRPELEAVAADCGPDTLAVGADVTDRTQVRHVVDQALRRFGGIDVWINNAGQGISRLPSELTDDDIDEMMRANVKSALYGMQEVLPHFKARGAGHVINISSELGRMPYVPVRAAYSGAKHYLNALTANFRDEVQAGHPAIHFSIVSPGVVRTEFGVRARHGGADSRLIPNSQSAEDVAAIIASVIDTKQKDVYTQPGALDRVLAYYRALST
ncbi:MAG: SDR family NAD(P)-dependent oxidoreductase [Acidobacteria bacterium]|nr:SDR family NAD(P)-dependent oxidoreductase [Acidobacteriota bacterium]